MMTMSERPRLEQLLAELQAADISVPAIGSHATDESETEFVVYTYAVDGEIIDLPPAAAPILAAHVPAPPETPPTDILMALLADVTDVDETKPILEAMLMILGGVAYHVA